MNWSSDRNKQCQDTWNVEIYCIADCITFLYLEKVAKNPILKGWEIFRKKAEKLYRIPEISDFNPSNKNVF